MWKSFGEEGTEEYFASMPVTNTKVLCVGSITRAEAEAAQSDGVEIDGRGYYLFLADESEPAAPISLLARFFSESEASHFARLLESRAAAF